MALTYIDRGREIQRAVGKIVEQRTRDQRIAAAVAKLERKGVRIIPLASWEDRQRIRALENQHDQVQVDSRKHVRLACHAAYVDPHAHRGDSIVYVCTDLRSHKPAEDAVNVHQSVT